MREVSLDHSDGVSVADNDRSILAVRRWDRRLPQGHRIVRWHPAAGQAVAAVYVRGSAGIAGVLAHTT